MDECSICHEPLDNWPLPWHNDCFQSVAARAGLYVASEMERVSKSIAAFRESFRVRR